VPLLFGGAIFASAFLIFLVQPLVGKRILPWFGGVPAVWILCLAFYQTTLFLGYAYAHALIRFVRPGLQLGIHALALGAALLTLPVLPGESWQPAGADAPGAAIVAMLAVNVALPFLVLAATGPLVQAWFARRHPERSPYFLYAVSNVGSLLALLAYPFLVEPRLTLSATGRVWSIAFAFTGAAVLGCAAVAGRRGEAPGRPAGEATPLAPATVALWILLSGTAVALLMGVTNRLCLDVASVPFLWILPLTAYLATLILCFGAERAYRRAPWALASGLPLLAFQVDPGGLTVRGGLDFAHSIAGQAALYLGLLFAACMVMHGELYRLRPPHRALTAFYLCVSGGGALGGLLVGIVAPRVFDTYFELPLGVAAAGLLLLAACRRDPRSLLRAGAPRWRWAGVAALVAAGVVYAIPPERGGRKDLLHEERTFFGVLRVVEYDLPNNRQRQLHHGTTLHGVQFWSRGARRKPGSYYGPLTGIGLAMRERNPDPSSVGIVGLGVGTLAAYGRPGDRFRFYEIDPAVVRIARDAGHFSFLADSAAEIEIALGDARLSLAAELAERGGSRYDILVMDAFTSDAIAVHLLTREAFEIYAASMRRSGLLAFHVTNQHFDLSRLVARQGRGVGLHALDISNEAAARWQSATTRWMFLSADEARLQSLEEFARTRWLENVASPKGLTLRRPVATTEETIPLWTDDYSDLFGALAKPE
jgi:spermidine synthase